MANQTLYSSAVFGFRGSTATSVARCVTRFVRVSTHVLTEGEFYSGFIRQRLDRSRAVGRYGENSPILVGGAPR